MGHSHVVGGCNGMAFSGLPLLWQQADVLKR